MFNYITLRAVLAALTALVISFLAGPAMIRKLAAYKIGQAVRDDGPQTHLTKAGTPTMGGALILVSVAVTTILWADWTNRFVWIVLAVTLGFGAIGWVDDYRKVVHRNPKGLSAREKYFWQSVIGLVAAVYLAFAVPTATPAQGWALFTQWVSSGFAMDLPGKADLIVPFFKNIAYPLGVVGFIVLSYFVIVGTSQRGQPDRRPRRARDPAGGDDRRRARDLRLRRRQRGLREVPALPLHPGRERARGRVRRAVGAGLGFLWFNAYPAEVFMGDVGALALGAALGTIAVIARQEIVLFIMGGVFVAETLSVMLQVIYFKLTGGKRIFRMAPLHHHYELGGWKETQVVVRFWIITVVLVLFGLSTLKLR